ncbi:MAG: DUF2764 family protein [Prolixibacteraceae bacterium]
MSAYYAFIAGLPDLEFDPEPDLALPVLYPGMLEEILSAEELEWVRLLWLRKFHLKIVSWLSGEDISGDLPLELPVEAFHSGNEAYQELPQYLRQLVAWKENDRGSLPSGRIAHRLQCLYFKQLLTSGNHFLQNWGAFELNLLNFLAARRSELLSKEKKQALIPGNDYHDLLLEFTSSQKIIQTEFPPAAKLEAVYSGANLRERELETDKLRWNAIDEINRFEYFSVDVILGYFQKLLLLERWKTIYHPPVPVDAVTTAERLINYA